jgi:glycosyltransferase involved in cell wall biosynthesis
VLNLHDLQHRHFPEYFSTEELQNREKWWVASALRADALIAASHYVREDLHQQLHICREKIFVTPDVFESAFFRSPNEEQLQSLCDRLDLPEMFFIYPAACWPHKNHERLIRAFLAANLSGAQLVLTGGGQESLASWAKYPNIRLLGRVATADLIGLYHLATAMIFPSQHESWSIPIMEAMACSCPVACANVTSLPEQIGDAGLLFEPDDESQITAVIRRLAGDPDLREILSKRGRCRVKQWSPSLFLKTITAAYGFATGAFYARRAA